MDSPLKLGSVMLAIPMHSGEPVKVICAWCEVTLSEGKLPASHGCCPDCEKRILTPDEVMSVAKRRAQ